MSTNPYEPPETDPGETHREATRGRYGLEVLGADDEGDVPSISTAHTAIGRYIAASLDSFFALISAVVAAKAVPEDAFVWQVVLLVTGYLGYFLIFEGFMSRTPGKLLTGVMIVQYDGQRCTWRQALIRTLFRLVEVNPVIGALPAILRITFSKYHQRFGDRFAKTIVVQKNRVL